MLIGQALGEAEGFVLAVEGDQQLQQPLLLSRRGPSLGGALLQAFELAFQGPLLGIGGQATALQMP